LTITSARSAPVAARHINLHGAHFHKIGTRGAVAAARGSGPRP